jgi:hypothetical protein
VASRRRIYVAIAKVITTGGRNYRWVFLKIITSEPGLHGIGSANNNTPLRKLVTLGEIFGVKTAFRKEAKTIQSTRWPATTSIDRVPPLASRKKNHFPPVVKELPQEWVRFRRVTCTEASKQVWVWTSQRSIRLGRSGAADPTGHTGPSTAQWSSLEAGWND